MTEREADTKWLSNIVYAFIIGFAVSVFVSSLAFVPPLLSLLLALVSLAIFAGEKILNGKAGREAALVSVFVLAFSCGSLRYAWADFHKPSLPASEGVVASDPERRENSTRFIYLADNGERALVNAPLYAEVEYGDRIRVEGRFEEPGVIESEETGRSFDYGKYLAKDDIYHTLSFAKIEAVGADEGHPVKSALFKIKNGFVSRVREILAEPHASLLAGLIVAGRDALPEDIIEEFRRSGIVHIVVLSGFNITLIAEFMRRIIQALLLLVRKPRPAIASLGSVMGVLLFVVMTGGEATVVRASIMALVVAAAGLFGRSYSPSRALFFAGFLMILENPKILVFDPSFQLSFLATSGLIYLSPLIDGKLGFLPGWMGMRQIISQTISTQFAVLPLLIYSMGEVSLVSLPANIAVLLAVPHVMLAGFLAAMVSFISSLAAWPLAFVSHLLLSWILFVSSVLGNLPFAAVEVPPVPFWPVAMSYVLVVLAVFRRGDLAHTYDNLRRWLTNTGTFRN